MLVHCFWLLCLFFASFSTLAHGAHHPQLTHLPPDVLHHLLYVEPTLHLEMLGNVRQPVCFAIVTPPYLGLPHASSMTCLEAFGVMPDVCP